MQIRRNARVDIRPVTVSAQHLDVQLEVTVDVWVERARAPMLADEPSVPASRVEISLPREEDAVAEPNLERLELGREFGMQQCGDAVRLRVVEQQVGVGAQPLMAALFSSDRVVPGESDSKAAGGEFVSTDPAARDNESRDGRIGWRTIGFERVNAGGVLPVSIAGALERVTDRLSSPSGFDLSLPTLEAPSHGVRIGRIIRVIRVFLWGSGTYREATLKGVAHPRCLRASFLRVPGR